MDSFTFKILPCNPSTSNSIESCYSTIEGIIRMRKNSAAIYNASNLLVIMYPYMRAFDFLKYSYTLSTSGSSLIAVLS